MDIDELRSMNLEDLRVKEREAREELFRLRLRLHTNQLDNPATYRKARKELAQVMTLITLKSSGAKAAAGKRGDAAAS